MTLYLLAFAAGIIVGVVLVILGSTVGAALVRAREAQSRPVRIDITPDTDRLRSAIAKAMRDTERFARRPEAPLS